MERRFALVVDHDVATGELISKLLEARGYQTATATTYAQAVTLFAATGSGLLVIDPVLTDGDGLKLVRIAKSSARVILTSAFPIRIATAAEDLGVPLVVKPFAADDFLTHVG